MESSIWHSTLESFLDRVAGPESTPASVTAAAVTAGLASALLIKVLEIIGKRKDFAGDRRKVAELIQAARREMTKQVQVADADILVFRSYMDHLRMPKVAGDRGERERGIFAAARQAVEVPMSAVRSAVRALELCVETIDIAHSFVAADVGGAAALLSGAVRTMVVSIDSNVRLLCGDENYCAATMVECRALGEQAVRLAEKTLGKAMMAVTTPQVAESGMNDKVKAI